MGTYFLIALLMAFACGAIASSKGRSGFGYFLFGLLFWPLALIIILVESPNTAKLETRATQGGGMKKCPDCAELVRREARRCRYCAADLGA